MMAIGMILNLAKLKLDFNEHHREIGILAKHARFSERIIHHNIYVCQEH
jgi:hypothetical protein